ncbi:CHAT domain-containing protein [Amycolatopsis sp. lyj-108]|uniref:CHAT domain-containing protein n=1 Tax=Amycolatopsis sp. lyj-108 TaxID=2789286 RepID=UPI00397C67C8
MITAEVLTGGLNVGRATDLTVRLTNHGAGVCTNIVFTLRLPPQVSAVRGSKELEVGRLAPGESCSGVVRVRPLRAGSWTAGANFSFRDPRGAACRIPDFSAALVVAPPVEEIKVPPPRFEVALATPVLAHGEWDILRGSLTNIGETPIEWGRVSLRGPFTVDPGGTFVELVSLPPGEQEPFEFPLLAGEAGREVPVHVTAVCTDKAAQRAQISTRFTVQVSQAGKVGSGQIRILYLSANPDSEQRLRLAREVRDIKETLRKSAHRERFELDDHGALQTRDLTQALLDHKPRIVHFSGHGDEDGRFIAENAGGGQQPLPVAGVAALFAEMAGTVECVLVNACHSETMAKALSEHIAYVIGMRSWIGDQSAMDFSVGFYQALGAGLEIEPAYRMARASMMTGDGHGRGGEVPVLFRKEH